MLEISRADITVALRHLDVGLSRYCWIQEHVGRCDVTTDAEFQRRFNGFYRVRRDGDWRSAYYALMQSAKDAGIEFAEVLDQLHRETGRMEASFASKLVATLDPTKPVLDSVVLSHFGLHLPYLHAADRQAKIGRVYEGLSAAHADLASSPVGCLIGELFDQTYPETNLTPLKKLDLVLWQVRPRDS